MNNRRPNFHFDEGNGTDKRSDIWKRFGFNPEEERRMFYETTPTNHGFNDWQSKFHRPPQFDDTEWRNRSMFNEPGSSSPSFGRRMRMGSNFGADDEIPIRIVHERTPPASTDDGNDSETSSQASHGSQGSSTSGSGQPMRAKITREPRVHHIPIMVEPRDGSTSSGYASDGGGGNQAANPQHSGNEQRSSGSNLSKQNSVDSNMDTTDYPPPNVQNLKKNFEHGHPPESRRDSHVRTIPIKVLHEESAKPSVSSPKSRQPPARSFSANSFGSSHSDMPSAPRPRKASSHPPMSSPSATYQHNGPHVTKVPVNAQNQKREISPEPVAESENKSRVKPTPNHLDEIKAVVDELDTYKKQINGFGGKPQDKEYRYLDEMLTRLMLKLDNVETNGQDDIRQARKGAVREIESWLSTLEAKANGRIENVQDSQGQTIVDNAMPENQQQEWAESQSKEDVMETDQKEGSQPPADDAKKTTDSSETP